MNEEEYFKNRGIEFKHYALVCEWLSYLQSQNKKLSDLEVYDYGCGRGPFVHALRYFNVSATGYDINNTAINNTIGLAKGCTSTIPSSTEFDVVLCIDVLEHVKPEEEESVTKHLHAALKTGGTLIISVCDVTLKNVYRDETHINLRTRNYWRSVFTKLGLNEVEVPRDWSYRDQMFLFTK